MSPDDPEPGGGRLRSPGVLVAVVGPSGAGKDTLMSRAARHPGLDGRIRFARRIVTRHALVASEDHESLDERSFAQAQAQGAFCLSWAAHGLRYALPRSVGDELAAGRTLVANLSRRSLADAADAFGAIAIVEITARPEILLERLLSRGREAEATIRDRLGRQAPVALPGRGASHVRIDNSGEVEAATELFVTALNHICRGG